MCNDEEDIGMRAITLFVVTALLVGGEPDLIDAAIHWMMK